MTAGNLENKYESRNPIINLLVNNFLETILVLIKKESKNLRILEVGCGEGYILQYLIKKNSQVKFFGVDISSKMVKLAKQRNPQTIVTKTDALKLPFPQDFFESVILCEILEHLETPEEAIKEARRVSKKFCLFSVPLEPWWRILNLMRFKYISRLGNTVGHINHWRRNQFVHLISKHLKIVNIRNPFPWTIIKAKKTSSR